MEGRAVYRKELSYCCRSIAIPTPKPIPNGTSFATAAQITVKLIAAPTPVPNPISQQTPATAAPKEPVYMIAAPYPGAPLYPSRPFDKAETQESCNLAEEASRLAQLEKQRKLECNQNVLIDSICPKSSLGIPPPVAS
jgi:hypothetical protein